jgi:rRNA biogenesis protein RRP5
VQRLVPSSLVLAQIVSIRPLELIVSLPGQLLGHIPITNISKAFTSTLESNDSDESDDEDDDSGIPNLEDIFSVGQTLVASVVGTKTASETKVSLGNGGKRSNDEDWKGSRRVELTLYPDVVNAQVRKEDLVAGFVCWFNALLWRELTKITDPLWERQGC